LRAGPTGWSAGQARTRRSSLPWPGWTSRPGRDASQPGGSSWGSSAARRERPRTRRRPPPRTRAGTPPPAGPCSTRAGSVPGRRRRRTPGRTGCRARRPSGSHGPSFAPARRPRCPRPSRRPAPRPATAATVPRVARPAGDTDRRRPQLPCEQGVNQRAPSGSHETTNHTVASSPAPPMTSPPQDSQPGSRRVRSATSENAPMTSDRGATPRSCFTLGEALPPPNGLT
jgi:hypothetical protein